MNLLKTIQFIAVRYKIIPMSQKLRLPNIGSKTTINGLLKPILSPESDFQFLSDSNILHFSIDNHI